MKAQCAGFGTAFGSVEVGTRVTFTDAELAAESDGVVAQDGRAAGLAKASLV